MERDSLNIRIDECPVREDVATTDDLSYISCKLKGMIFGTELPQDIIDFANDKAIVIVYPKNDHLVQVRGIVNKDISVGDEITSYCPFGSSLIINQRLAITVTPSSKKYEPLIENKDKPYASCLYFVEVSRTGDFPFWLYKVSDNGEKYKYALGRVCVLPTYDRLDTYLYAGILNWTPTHLKHPMDGETVILCLQEPVGELYKAQSVAIGCAKYNKKSNEYEWYVKSYSSEYYDNTLKKLDGHFTVKYWSELPYTPSEAFEIGHKVEKIPFKYDD